MGKLFQFAIILMSVILSAVALFAGSSTAISIVLWWTLCVNGFILVCLLIAGASKVL